MAVVIVITHSENNEIKELVQVDRKLILGSSIYCDIFLEDKGISGMQCQFHRAKTGHLVATNLDLKKEVLLNQTKLKKAALKANDVLKIGHFVLSLDLEELTPEEKKIMDSEYEEFV